MEIDINITGGSYKHSSLPVSAQVTRNLWPQLIDDQITSNKYILTNFVGQNIFGTAVGVGRGQKFFNGLLYRVCGTKLYSVDESGNHSELGNIPGSARCIFDGLGSYLIIVTEQKAYVWDGATLTRVTDLDLESPNSVTVLNNQAIYDGDNDRFGVSDVGDPSVIDGLNYATAESKGDNLIRVFAFDQNVYMFGESTIEQWWNSGVGQPPFDRIQNGIIEIGLASLYAVDSNVNFTYFLGSDKRVYQARGAARNPVSDAALVKEFESYSTISDAILWCMDIRNQNFVVLTFPTAKKTWVLPEGGQWFEWSSGTQGGRNVANSYALAYDKHIVEDYRNGNLYELDFDTYTENGDTIIRQRDSAPINRKILGVQGEWVYMKSLTFEIESGVGLSSGQGSDPELMFSYSDDGGKSFSTERFVKLGKQGQYGKRVKITGLGRFKERILRVKYSDPTAFTLIRCRADIVGGL